MCQKIILCICSSLLILLTACGFESARPVIQLNGSEIVLEQGRHKIEGTLQSESTYEFLLVSDGFTLNSFSGDAFVSMIPREKAIQLREKFGDFFKCKCNEPGRIQTINSIQGSILVAGNDNAIHNIREALSLLKRSFVPAVIFQGSKIAVSKRTYKDMEYNDSTGIVLYYLYSFHILKQDFMK